MVNVKLFHIRKFIPMPYEEALEPRLRIAQEKLQNATGTGSDFVGWVHLPQAFDRAEFARIKQAGSAVPIWEPGASSNACALPITT